MKKFAKLLAMVLAVSMVLTMFVGAVDYKDADKITEGKEDAIQAVYEWGIMQGKGANNFDPQGNLTRDEMAKIMYALEEVGLLEDEDNKALKAMYASFAGMFDDEFFPEWSQGYVGYANAEGIFVGNDKNEFNPLGTLTYVDAAIVLMRAIGLEDTPYDDPEDDTANTVKEYTGSKWYQNAVKDAILNGLYDNLEIDNYKNAISREDVAVMICNIVNGDETKAAAADNFKLAKINTGVVIGKNTVEKVDYFKVAGIEGDKDYEIGDRKLADYIGKEVTWAVEAGEVVSELAVLTQGVVTVELGDIKYDAKKETLTIGDVVLECKADKQMKAPAYYFIETVKEVSYDNLKIADMIAKLDEVDEDDLWQEVTVVLNENSLSVFDAGIKFIEFVNNKETKNVESDATYDADTKTWNYSYTYTFGEKKYSITEEMSKIKDGTLLAVKVIDGAVEIVGYPEYVSLEKVAVKNTKDGLVYTVDGEEKVLYNVYGTDDVDLYANQGKKGTETANYYAIVYGDKILGTTTETVEVNTPKPVYGIIVDWTISPAEVQPADKDADKEDVQLATVAVVIDGVVKTIKYVNDGTEFNYGENVVVAITANDDYAEAEGIYALNRAACGAPAVIKEYKVTEDGKSVTFKTATPYTKKLDEFTFVDLTGTGYVATDLAIGEHGVTTIAGKATAPNTAKLVRFGEGEDAVYLVIFDDNEKEADRFGAYGKIVKQD